MSNANLRAIGFDVSRFGVWCPQCQSMMDEQECAAGSCSSCGYPEETDLVQTGGWDEQDVAFSKERDQ